jgi:hypothetical protein
MVFAWIDLVQTAIQILILKSGNGGSRPGSEEEEEREVEEGILLGAGWNARQSNVSQWNRRQSSRQNDNSESPKRRSPIFDSESPKRRSPIFDSAPSIRSQRPNQSEPLSSETATQEENRKMLTSKAISAFVITFITIVGVITISYQERQESSKPTEKEMNRGKR